MPNNVYLTRKQFEQLVTVFALQQNVESVTIEETHESGIGATTRAQFHTGKTERDFEMDITDVSVW